MKNFVRYIVFIALVSVSSFGYAQDQAVYNHYISNQGILNPAYNGTRDFISGLAVFRSQWIGMEGAPYTGALNVHGPIEQVDNLGAGIVLSNDHLGFTNNLEFFAAASYRLKVDRKHTLSLGLQLGFKNVVYDGSKANPVDYGDPLFTSRISKFGFNFGFGGYMYTKNYFVGLSIPRFFQNKLNTNKQEIKNIVSFKDLHTYIYGGYVFDIDDILVRPTALIRVVPGAPLQLDVSCSILLIEKLWLGLSYRTVTDLVFFGEYQIDRRWAIKYSFDYPMSTIHKHAKFGSHEIGVQFDFSTKRRPGMRSIRNF